MNLFYGWRRPSSYFQFVYRYTFCSNVYVYDADKIRDEAHFFKLQLNIIENLYFVYPKRPQFSFFKKIEFIETPCYLFTCGYRIFYEHAKKFALVVFVILNYNYFI